MLLLAQRLLHVAQRVVQHVLAQLQTRDCKDMNDLVAEQAVAVK